MFLCARNFLGAENTMRHKIGRKDIEINYNQKVM